MDNLEYKHALEQEMYKLRRRISINASIALGGMFLAGGVILSDTVKTYNLANELLREPAIKEIYLSEIHPEIEREKELKKILQEEYQPKVESGIKTQKLCAGLAGTSAAYFLLGCAIPLAFYNKKKKSIEEKMNDED